MGYGVLTTQIGYLLGTKMRAQSIGYKINYYYSYFIYTPIYKYIYIKGNHSATSLLLLMNDLTIKQSSPVNLLVEMR